MHLPKVGELRRERVIRDLWPCPRQSTQQSAFAGIRFPNETDIGNDFQFQNNPPLFPDSAGRFFTWRLVGRGLEMGVSPSASTSFGHDKHFAIGRQIANHKLILAVDDHRTRRNLDGAVLPPFPMPVGSHAMGATPCLPLFSMG